MAKKNFWPIGLTVFITAFLVLTVTFVIIVSSMDFDLVEDEYYQKGIDYQQTIDMRERSEKLPVKPEIKYENNRLLLTFPVELLNVTEGGNIYFYRSSDRNLDMREALQLDSKGMQIFETSGIKPGNWQISLRWQMAGLPYILEENLYIQ